MTEQPSVTWLPFGFHGLMDNVPRLLFSDARGDDGLPLWERHAFDDTCDLCRSHANAGGKT